MSAKEIKIAILEASIIVSKIHAHNLSAYTLNNSYLLEADVARADIELMKKAIEDIKNDRTYENPKRKW